MRRKSTKPEENVGTPEDVRGLRYAADVLAAWANRKRVDQIWARGVDEYLRGILGDAAHQPARSVLLVFDTKTQRVVDIIDKTLLEYLTWRANRGHDLPKAAVLTDGTKLYL
jgi:hypothetical protein